MDKHELTGPEYLDLYKFFQNRADAVKASMFSTATWLIGFAIGLLGFIFATLVEYEDSTIDVLHWEIAFICCLIGGFLCVYTFFVLWDAADHITGNWERSKVCESHIKEIDKIIKAYKSKRLINEPWYVIGFVVAALLFVFILTGIYVFEN